MQSFLLRLKKMFHVYVGSQDVLWRKFSQKYINVLILPTFACCLGETTYNGITQGQSKSMMSLYQYRICKECCWNNLNVFVLCWWTNHYLNFKCFFFRNCLNYAMYNYAQMLFCSTELAEVVAFSDDEQPLM